MGCTNRLGRVGPTSPAPAAFVVGPPAEVTPELNVEMLCYRAGVSFGVGGGVSATNTGIINNAGSLLSEGRFRNQATLINFVGALLLIDGGTFLNDVGATLTNSGNLSNNVVEHTGNTGEGMRRWTCRPKATSALG